ncbi:Pentatricopeptide repeat-containing protein [Smittium culicis]|uniref:Pentatricopeptide repeat-containing protein n=1 Tax=Smittium culicis TaxID=133412 RepID=A0A1R1YFN3_9FUNG|nr:Pentatricopeptide repeat-containing protein [Smittium culicis]
MVYDIYCTHGYKDNVFVDNSIMFALLLNKKYTEADFIWNQISGNSQIDSTSYSIVISHLVNLKNVSQALELYSQMKFKKIKPNQFIYSTLLKGISSINDDSSFDLIYSIFQDMVSNNTPISIIVLNSILSGCIISKNFNLAYLALDKIKELNLKKSIQTRILALKIFELSKNYSSFFDQVNEISDCIVTDLSIKHSKNLNIPSNFTKDEIAIAAKTKHWRHHEFFSVISGFFNLKLYPYAVLYGSLIPYHSINLSKSTSVLIINSLISILENNKTSSANNVVNSLTIPGASKYMNIHNLLSSYPNLLSSLSDSNPFSSIDALPESSSINPSFKTASVNIQNVFYDVFNRSKNYITVYKKLPLSVWLKFFKAIKNSFGLEFAVFISNILLETEPLSKHKSTILAKIIENLVADYNLKNLNFIQRQSKLKHLGLKPKLNTTLDSVRNTEIFLKPNTESNTNKDLFFIINSLVTKLEDLLLDFPQANKVPKIKSFTENSKLPKFDSSIPAVKLSNAYWAKLIWVYKENNQLPKAIHIFRLISLSKIFDLSSIPYASLFINLELNSEAVKETPFSDSNSKLHHSDVSQYKAIQEVILIALSVSFNKNKRIDHNHNSLSDARNIFDYDVTTHITNYFLQNQTQDSLTFLFKVLELISLSINLKIKFFFYGFSQKNSILDPKSFLKAIEISAINGYWDVWERFYSLSIELEKSIRLGPTLTQILVNCQGWDIKFIFQ